MRKAEALGRSLGSDRFRAPTFGQAWSRVEASFRQAPHARRPKPRRRNLKAMPPNGFHRRPKRLRRHSWRRALLRCKPPLLPPQPGVPSTRQCRLPVGPVPTSSAAPLSDDAVRSATASPIDRVLSTTPISPACTRTSRWKAARCSCATRPPPPGTFIAAPGASGMDPNQHGANEARARMEHADRPVDRDLPGGARPVAHRAGSSVNAPQSPEPSAALASGLTQQPLAGRRSSPRRRPKDDDPTRSRRPRGPRIAAAGGMTARWGGRRR